MKLSVYTFVKDGLYYDFHVVDMLKHHLPLADEIIVNEGYSRDETFEAICDIDSKIRVVQNEWDRSDPKAWSKRFKNQARQLCTGEWCILLDCDEFIPEWEFERIRTHLEQTEYQIVPLRHLHFYGNYRVIQTQPERFGWPVTKRQIHRNRDNFEVWGDGSNVGPCGTDDPGLYDPVSFECHHFGFVRNPARLRQKWRTQNRRNAHNSNRKPRWDRTPGFLFDLSPHKWDDPDILEGLEIYNGPYVKAVRDNPEEFVRDDFQLFEYLSQKHEKAQVD